MRPQCTILGGANGSGKSSIFDIIQPVGRFINADVVARRIDPISPERASLAAGREVLAELRSVVGRSEDFVYETTLSSEQSLSLMRSCRDAEYEINLVYVVLRNPDLNVLRVAERVRRGGHGIPEQTIRRRYEGSLEKLREAAALADNSLVFDNSALTPELLLAVAEGQILSNALALSDPLHARLARAFLA